MNEDRRIEVRISSGLLAEVDAARGDVPRAKWIKRALEKALATSGGGGSPGVSKPVVPASPRASAGPRVMADYELPKIAPRKPR